MKIIFLDIDGVLNNLNWFKYNQDKKGTNEFYFAPHLVNNLNAITDTTGAEIVVSSSWRKSRDIDELKRIFKEVGITGRVIGKTKSLYFNNHYESVPRGCEVKQWIKDNKEILDKDYLHWKSYVIIDDETDYLFEQRNHLFICDNSAAGLSANLAYQIINFLKSY